MRPEQFTRSRCILFFLLNGIFLSACTSDQQQIRIAANMENPKIQFAVEEISAALLEKGVSIQLDNSQDAHLIISVNSEDSTFQKESFQIQKTDHQVHITGADEGGLMYGGIELAEQIRLFGWEGVQETTQHPYMELRGTKFNIPLDVRTPSYSDPSDAAQKNLPVMWDFEFWKEYLDNLARYRYNFVSLWSLHPFPSMVQVPGYEEVALDDVQRSSVQWKEYYSRNGIGFDAPDILANPEIVKTIPIEEKIAFWQKVMKYGKDRNIDFYVITWNIFVNGTKGQYGITEEISNPVTRDYFRKSIKQMFVSYPDLAGIGLTTGENMKGATTDEKEDWAYETFGKGLLDAASQMPDRRFTFIHRQHQTGALEIAKKFQELVDHPNISFIFSFKYAKAHVMSATRQPYHEDFVKEITGMKTIWTLRNDDAYQYRWGAPDFVREFIKNIPYEVSRGYYYGSDQWIWGREFLSKQPENPRQLEIVKHWYHWMMWGRLGFNPNMSNDRFIDILQHQFPTVDASQLFNAWQEASMIYPTTTGFHWGRLDFHWYIEACKGAPVFAQNETGFHDVNRFINLPPHPKSGFQSIPEFVEMTLSGGSSDLLSPFLVSQKLHGHADRAIEILNQMEAGQQDELALTLNDIRTIALLGKYYACKINGATNLALFRETNEQTYQKEAVSQLTQAKEFWEQYTSSTMQQNINPLWTNRVGYVDWQEITKWVKQDIDIAQAG